MSRVGFRPEIQGLRAVAVVLVVLYHVWPHFLSGGYVGVDVFFVISGFLITGLLLRELEQTGSVSISRFYGRRIKRLLPAASLVLVVIGAASFWWLPVTRLEDTAWEILASALYLENWVLAYWSVDYLAEGRAASPVQHYWTLSVEEQFYIAWPWLMLLFAGLALRLGGSVRSGLWWLVLVALSLSFVHSVHATANNQPLAFFMTTTRVWELALGALLALALLKFSFPAWLRQWAGITGVAAIVLAAVFYSSETAFPGYTALLPTAGAALVILAGQTPQWLSVSRPLSSRPFQYLGNVSYTLYLWHWPVVVFYKLLVDAQPGFVDGLIIIALSLVLTHVTYVLLEAPVHRSRLGERGAGKPFALGGACIALCIATAVGLYSYVSHLQEQTPAVVDVDVYPGARALFVADGRINHPGIDVIPNPLGARDDNAVVYRDGCRTRQQETTVNQCVYGQPDGDFHLVLAGDSYAAHWLPALRELADQRGWKVTVFNKSACIFADVTLERWGRDYHECVSWNQGVLDRVLELRPDVLVTSHSPGHTALGAQSEAANLRAIAEGYVQRWSRLVAADIPVIAIRETARMASGAPECVARYGEAAHHKCALPREAALALPSSFTMAVDAVDGVTLLDMNDALCDEDTCYAVIGNILVYRDRGHLTATYARSMAPVLGEKLDEWVGSPF